MPNETGVKISYYLKNPISCPVCGARFQKEEMLSGGGRLIARDISDELRRGYQPSKKAGEVCPLNYPVTVCPECLYAAYHEDFPHISSDRVDMAQSQAVKRGRDLNMLFSVVDFSAPRNLVTGAASYLLAVGCYAFHAKERVPSFKKALSTLRAAWLMGDLDRKFPGQNYDQVQVMLYRKAAAYYQRVVELSQSGKERIDSIRNFGPDLDKNYGFEGVLFLTSLLTFKYSREQSTEQQVQTLENAKRTVSRVFGSGKKSKDKPSSIIELSRELYERIGERIEEIKAGA